MGLFPQDSTWQGLEVGKSSHALLLVLVRPHLEMLVQPLVCIRPVQSKKMRIKMMFMYFFPSSVNLYTVISALQRMLRTTLIGMPMWIPM